MLSAGHAVELEVNLHAELTRSLFEAVVVATSPDRIVLALRVRRRRDLKVDERFPVHLHIIDRSTIQSFEATVLSQKREAGDVLLTLTLPEKLAEERREYFRLECRVPVSLGFDAEDGSTIEVDACTVDMSGGGIAVVIAVSPRVGAGVDLSLSLDPLAHQAVSCRGRVARVHDMPLSDPLVHRVGITFDRPGAAARDAIVRYIFDRQRELRKKGAA